MSGRIFYTSDGRPFEVEPLEVEPVVSTDTLHYTSTLLLEEAVSSVPVLNTRVTTLFARRGVFPYTNNLFEVVDDDLEAQDVVVCPIIADRLAYESRFNISRDYVFELLI